MKNLLSYQVTECDCASVSLCNIFTYLFDRNKIEPIIIKKIYECTLDNYNGYGTSKKGIEKFVNWFNNYNSKKLFNLKLQRFIGSDVSIEKIKECIDNDGAVLIRCWQLYEHYAIITDIDDKDVYIFDPYYLDTYSYILDPMVNIITSEPFKYNRKVAINRLLSISKKDFSLGTISNRECILFMKK